MSVILEIMTKVINCNWVTVIGLFINGSILIVGFFIIRGKTFIPVNNPQNNFGLSFILLATGIIILGLSGFVLYTVLSS